MKRFFCVFVFLVAVLGLLSASANADFLPNNSNGASFILGGIKYVVHYDTDEKTFPCASFPNKFTSHLNIEGFRYLGNGQYDTKNSMYNWAIAWRQENQKYCYYALEENSGKCLNLGCFPSPNIEPPKTFPPLGLPDLTGADGPADTVFGKIGIHKAMQTPGQLCSGGECAIIGASAVAGTAIVYIGASSIWSWITSVISLISTI